MIALLLYLIQSFLATVVNQIGVTSFERVTSWFRDRDQNAAVGGVANSQHLLGLALDFSELTEAEISALEARGMTVIQEADHVHVQFVNGTLGRVLVQLFGV